MLACWAAGQRAVAQKHLFLKQGHSLVYRLCRPYASDPHKTFSQSLFDDDFPVDLREEEPAARRRKPESSPPDNTKKGPRRSPTPAEHAQHRLKMKQDFPDGWDPPRKISREAMDGLRQLHLFDRETFTTPVLAEKFRISPEAVRRILKSRWVPSRGRLAQMAEKERRERLEERTVDRLREKVEADRATELKRMARGGVRDGAGRTIGIGANDRFTFE